ncbi:Na+-dependent transporter [Xanthobacteraceae bacterium Astr-EGSB]|uniref:Na+-dependent transporter n=1 Tax=Astrobacterium formosum TaxID=3069710 RepID=UPI0027B1CD52|nr:Na+-dependent transporter [Xanthobacteraceae bacterium Astr-EGSB]
MPLASPVALLCAGLAALGRRGSEALAASVFIGIAVPPLAAFAKPIFAEALFVLLVLSFLRVDPAALRRHAARPGLILAALAWIMLAVPLLAGGALALTGLADAVPPLYAAMMLQAMAPPLVSAPALAALMGLDAALSLATLIACLAAAPVTAAAFAAIFLGGTVALTPLALGGKTLLILAGAAVIAAVIRRLAGDEVIARQNERIDGLNVVVLFVFAVAFMDGVYDHAGAAPLAAAGLVALTFAVAIAFGVSTFVVFARAGRADALSLAVTAALRNLGLMAAAAGGAVPELAWLYFAYAQLPIYLMPQLVKPLMRRLRPRGGA